jgi:pimeloyl-ACP methyl ester carboxylesterase
MQTSLFLVHGTFAGKAAWTSPDSPFCSYLKSRLQIADKIGKVKWSGANTTAAREAGVKDLTQKLSDSLQKHPTNKHVVIGHSHGGNIAVHAVSRNPDFAKVSVALLSTPFLIVRQRAWSYTFWLSFAIGSCLGLIFLIGFPVAVALAIGKLPKDVSVSLAPYPIIALLIAIGIAIGALLRAVYICFVMRKSTNRILKQNKLTIPPTADILIIRESGDEASNLLGGLQLLVGVFSTFFTCIEEWATALEAWSTKVSESKQSHVFGFVDHVHPAATELLNDTVVRDCLADHAQGCYGGSTPKSMKAEEFVAGR